MTEIENHTLHLLQAFREGFSAMEKRMDAMEKRMEAGFADVNRRLDSQQRVMQGESILGRYAVAEVEERLVRIEDYLDLPKRSA